MSDDLQAVRLDTISSHVDSNVKILDFGCGCGSFIKYAQGWVSRVSKDSNISGFDINPYGDYCDVTALLNGFNIVTFWDSLEHIKNPVKLIKGLNPEYIFISTPSTEDYDGDMLDYHHYYPGEHVHYFNHSSLSRLLSECGYKEIVHHYEESTVRKSCGEKNIITIGGVRG